MNGENLIDTTGLLRAARVHDEEAIKNILGSSMANQENVNAVDCSGRVCY